MNVKKLNVLVVVPVIRDEEVVVVVGVVMVVVVVLVFWIITGIRIPIARRVTNKNTPTRKNLCAGFPPTILLLKLTKWSIRFIVFFLQAVITSI